MLARRRVLAAAAGSLAVPALGRGAERRVLRFVPQADLAVLDPVASYAYNTRNHGLMVFDTLYGIDIDNRPQPQMVAGHVVADDGTRWTFRLRDGLRFHDGSPVLARDAVASLRRWAKRDNVGQALWAVVDEVSAADDRTILFRLKVPFPLLPAALGKMGTSIAAIMPERLAETDALRPLTEMVGSGPFRFLPGERVPGARAAYERFDGYLPRAEGTVSALAGPKRAHFDRVEWITIPDVATAAAALQAGEVDWWEQPSPDYWPALRRNKALRVLNIDPYGLAGVIRCNFLHPPTSNPAFRRAMLAAVSQADVMTAMAGDDREAWKDQVGFFLPGTPMASDAGMAALKEPPDRDAARRMLEASGYAGERVVFLLQSDIAAMKAQGEVVADALARIGVRVDLQVTDWGTLLARANNRGAPDKGGWHVFGSLTAGVGVLDPAGNNFLRGTGSTAIYGWPEIPELEALRTAWFRAPDEEARAAICARIQALAFEQVPYVPTGLFLPQTATRADIVDVPKGLPLFYGVRRA